MAKLKALILAAGACLVLADAAAAADLLPPAPALEPQPAPVEFNGWYLRGDVGVGANAWAPAMATTPNPLAGTNPGGFAYSAEASQTFNNTTISASEMYDVGVGYRFNPWLRGDVTLEYRGGSQFQSLYTLNDPTPPTTQYADFYRGNIDSVIGLVNAYVDIGTWYGMTPYVGGGVGFSHNMVSGFTDQGFGYYNGAPLGAAGGYFSNASENNFAWALMAGVDFNVTQNLKLELGYRYLDYGKFTTGTSNCLNGTGGFTCSGGSYTVYSTRTLASNDFRLGLIWMIGETPQPEAPLVRKY
jgi:opacity protein-like surface antigen